MTTTEPLSTTTEEATGRTGADRNTKLAWPATAMALGPLLATTGLILGRIRYAVPGGYTWNAVQIANTCHAVGQVTGHAMTSPMCSHAYELLALAGVLIGGGLIMAVAGTAVTARRLRARP